jgi:hypothetical protein
VERDAASAPEWSTWREAVRVVTYRPHLRRTIRIALVVGSLLFAINQLDVVVHGHATVFVWLKIALTYLVPFCVSNAGILIATSNRRRHDGRG